MNEQEVLENIWKEIEIRDLNLTQISKDCEISENYIFQMLSKGKSKRRKISNEILQYFGFEKIEFYRKKEIGE